MAKIADGVIYKFKTGDIVDADVAPTGGALNPIFELLRVSLNHTDDRVDGVYTKSETDDLILGVDLSSAPLDAGLFTEDKSSTPIDAGLFTDTITEPSLDGGEW